jgi:uncharacterized protein YoxC
MSTFASVLATIGATALLVIALALVAIAIFAWRTSRQVIRAARAAATSVAAAHALVRRFNPAAGELGAKWIDGPR